MSRVFVTGATGFVGERVVRLLEQEGHSVATINRTAGHARSGDLLNPGTYEAALRDCSAVVHLAAVTGKAPDDDYFRVNVEGTGALLAACRGTSVRRMVFVSSISVTFPDIRAYPYARSKLAAEKLVAESGLPFVIVRPTMIFGSGSPVLTGLERVATMPVVPAFAGARALVQPVDVDDVARILVDLALDSDCSGEIIEVGGSETLPLRKLLQRISVVVSGRERPILNIPVWPLIPPLRLLERVALRLVPFTVGQLATFRFDGVAQANKCSASLRPRAGLDVMLPLRNSGEADETILRKEVTVFVQLLGGHADDYIVQKYLRAHTTQPALHPLDGFEQRLVSFASSGVWQARIADAYSRRFLPRSSLRKKLVLVLALLESTGTHRHLVDAPVPRPVLAVAASLAVAGTVAAVALVVGVLRFGLAHLVSRRAVPHD